MANGVVPLDHAGLVQLVLRLQEENRQLRDRIADLEGKNPTRRFDESYSLNAEEKRREKKSSGKGKRRSRIGRPPGRRPTQEKVDQADQIELIFPDNFTIGQCTFARERPVWRIISGRAKRVVYEIYRGPNGETPDVSGVFPRCEFGTEIHVAVAFLVSVIGLSMDKVCAQLKFFWQLDLSQSQADALLNQLSGRWESEFETLCDLIAISAVVHADETGWSIHSVWAFLSERARVFVFGCHKDAETLAAIVPQETFAGILQSDNAAVYKGFSRSQKCWAHLLRKAIRLTLLFPEDEEYRIFLDGLLDVFREAKRIAADGRLSESGRAERVNDLDNQLTTLLVRYVGDEDEVVANVENRDSDFQNLVSELIGLMTDDELFTFVKFPEASATNNEAERSLRSTAQDRRTCRTRKMPKGARRRSVLLSVFESLKLHLSTFTLKAVQDEVAEWSETRESLFDRLRTAAGLDPPGDSRLSTLVPVTQSSVT